MKPAKFDYARRDSLEDTLSLRGQMDSETSWLAGGQTLGPMMNLRLARPSQLVDIHKIDELLASRETETSVVFGAGITHAAIEDGLHPDPTGGAMRRVAGGIAYRVVRNRGTLGGSVAHADPAADWLNFFSVTRALLHLRAPTATSETDAHGVRKMEVEDFLLSAYTTALQDGELIVGIEVPQLPGEHYFGYHKLCRKTGEFAHVIASTLVVPDAKRCEVVLSASTPKPLRLTGARAELARTAAPVSISQLKEEIGASTHGMSTTKLHMSAIAIHRSMSEALV